MKITTLAEKTSISKKFKNEHGLSLYIETKLNKILFDLGAGSLFADTAKKLDIDLSKVDIVVISHGHSDHGGGLETFLELNSTAKIYIKESAFNDYYSLKNNGEMSYIGLNKRFKDNNRLIFTKDYCKIDEELELYSNVSNQQEISITNKTLMKKDKDYIVQDDFLHEQNLIITQDNNEILVCGCAHNGIGNILTNYKLIKNNLPTHVIGGFHLSNEIVDKNEVEELVNNTCIELSKLNIKWYTGHCTGLDSYKKLKCLLRKY